MHRIPYATPVAGPWLPATAPATPARRWIARRLRRTGALLRRWAAHLLADAPARATTVPMTLPRLEYHADAGAPEGALYVDGEYVGRLGVRRL
jgi:hypothetical protein